MLGRDVLTQSIVDPRVRRQPVRAQLLARIYDEPRFLATVARLHAFFQHAAEAGSPVHCDSD